MNNKVAEFGEFSSPRFVILLVTSAFIYKGCLSAVGNQQTAQLFRK